MTDASRVMLRFERRDDGSSLFLGARIDSATRALVIEGQDLGPVAGPVSSDGEYEYAHSIPAEAVPAFLEHLGFAPTADPLRVLAENFSGPSSYALETAIRSFGGPTESWNWTG